MWAEVEKRKICFKLPSCHCSLTIFFIEVIKNCQNALLFAVCKWYKFDQAGNFWWNHVVFFHGQDLRNFLHHNRNNFLVLCASIIYIPFFFSRKGNCGIPFWICQRGFVGKTSEIASFKFLFFSSSFSPISSFAFPSCSFEWPEIFYLEKQKQIWLDIFVWTKSVGHEQKQQCNHVNSNQHTSYP